ncbi:putative MFS transporter [Hyaloscypha variabilis]
MAEKQDPEQDTTKAHAFTEPESPETYETFGLNKSRLVRRIDLIVLPPVTLVYLLSFLDRSNVGNAKLEGLTDDIKMTGDQYLTGLTLFFIGYVIFEVPCNVVLKLWRPELWLPTLAVVWGIVATLQGVVQNLPGFYLARFFLGVTEAGLFPGIVFYLSMWYKRNERQFRVALFFSAASLAGAFGGILAWGIAHMKGVGGYNGWRWIFILEGLLTVVVGVGAYFAIQPYPTTAKFLTDNERSLIYARLKADSDSTADEGFTWKNVAKTFTDIKVYLYCLGFHTMALPLYTLSLFLPTIIKDLGYTSAQAQLLTVPPYSLAFILTILFAIASERLRIRAPLIITSSSLAILGYILLLSDHTAGVSYLGTFFAAGGIYPSVALVLAWPANNISIGILGAVLGTQLYRMETASRYYLGHSFALGYLGANIIVVSILWYVHNRENGKRDAGQLQASESREWLGDEDPRWKFML